MRYRLQQRSDPAIQNPVLFLRFICLMEVNLQINVVFLYIQHILTEISIDKSVKSDYKTYISIRTMYTAEIIQRTSEQDPDFRLYALGI